MASYVSRSHPSLLLLLLSLPGLRFALTLYAYDTGSSSVVRMDGLMPSHFLPNRPRGGRGGGSGGGGGGDIIITGNISHHLLFFFGQSIIAQQVVVSHPIESMCCCCRMNYEGIITTRRR